MIKQINDALNYVWEMTDFYFDTNRLKILSVSDNVTCDLPPSLQPYSNFKSNPHNFFSKGLR